MSSDVKPKRRIEARDEGFDGLQGAARNPVHDDLRRIAAAYGTTISDAPDPASADATAEDLLLSSLAAAITPETPAEACLVPALAAVGWTGGVRDVKEVLPHFNRVRDVDALRSVLARLNYETHGHPVSFATLTTGMLP